MEHATQPAQLHSRLNELALRLPHPVHLYLMWKKETGFDWIFSVIILLFPIFEAFSIEITKALAMRRYQCRFLIVMVGWYFEDID